MKKEYMIPQSDVIDMVLKNSLLAGSEQMEKSEEETNEVQSGFFFGSSTDNEDW